MKPRIEPVTPGLQGKRFIHYTTAAPIFKINFLKVIFEKVNFEKKPADDDKSMKKLPSMQRKVHASQLQID